MGTSPGYIYAMPSSTDFMYAQQPQGYQPDLTDAGLLEAPQVEVIPNPFAV